MDDFAILVAGMVLAAVGGEVFVRGSIGLGAHLRVPVGIIGVTIAAFATSSPEVAVGLNAALAGTPQVSVGDALGSNVVNVALVMGVVLALGPIRLDRRDVQRDLPFTIGAPLLVALLCVDGRLSRIDGLVLLTVFFVWIGTTVRQALHSLESAAHVLGVSGPRASVFLTVGVSASCWSRDASSSWLPRASVRRSISTPSSLARPWWRWGRRCQNSRRRSSRASEGTPTSESAR